MERNARYRYIDEYLAAVPEDSRVALERLRRIIKAVSPEATELISYGIPTFDYRGKHLVGFAAFKNHCSFFFMSHISRLGAVASELKNYQTFASGIHFAAGKPLPAKLVRLIVRTRMAVVESSISAVYPAWVIPFIRLLPSVHAFDLLKAMVGIGQAEPVMLVATTAFWLAAAYLSNGWMYERARKAGKLTRLG